MLLLREDLLPELELRLLPLALGLLLRLLLLLPLEAEPRLLLELLRDEDEPDLEEEEELRDAIACSFGRLKSRAVASAVVAATSVNLGRPAAQTVGMHSPCA